MIALSDINTTAPYSIGLISNSRSGRNRKQLPAVQATAARYANIHHSIAHDKSDIEQALCAFITQNIDILAINGGDGSFDQVMSCALRNQLFTTMPPVVLLPGGTANMLVGDIGSRGKLPSLIERLACLTPQQLSRQQVLRPILQIKASPCAETVYGMCFAAGVVIQGIHYAHATIHSRGINEAGPGLAMLRTLWGLLRKDPQFNQPVPMTINIDDQKLSVKEDAMLVIISSLQRLFLGLHPFWNTQPNSIHFTAIRHQAKHLWRGLTNLLWGRSNHHMTADNGYRSCAIRNIRLHFDGSFVVDGELYTADQKLGPVDIGHGGMLRFIRL